jgi:hypothetical protein
MEAINDFLRFGKMLGKHGPDHRDMRSHFSAGTYDGTRQLHTLCRSKVTIYERNPVASSVTRKLLMILFLFIPGCVSLIIGVIRFISPPRIKVDDLLELNLYDAAALMEVRHFDKVITTAVMIIGGLLAIIARESIEHFIEHRKESKRIIDAMDKLVAKVGSLYPDNQARSVVVKSPVGMETIVENETLLEEARFRAASSRR